MSRANRPSNSVVGQYRRAAVERFKNRPARGFDALAAHFALKVSAEESFNATMKSNLLTRRRKTTSFKKPKI